MESVQNSCLQSSDYRDVPVAQLVESPTNPRKHYDETNLRELAESIRAQGVLAPLLVRAVSEDRFEIIAGSRRFRAARLASVESVPVRVVDLSDADAIIAQVVENLQRENVHPLEEAHGFRALLNLPGCQYNVASIAAKAGKNPQYVAQRLRFTELISEAAEAFLADRLTIGHALLIAKLPAPQQAEALKAAFKTTWTTNGQTEIVVPVKELSAWIEANILLELQTAPFDRAEGSLIPNAGTCHDCSKRTGANALLFPEADRDQCLDRECYHAKVRAHITTAIERNPQLVQISTAWRATHNGILPRGQYVEIAAAKASKNGRRKTPPESKKCSHMTKAIVVEGGNCGHSISVCADPSCEIHHSESRQAGEAQERMRSEQRKQNERRKQELATRSRVLRMILEKIAAPLGRADLELVAREFIARLPQEHRTLLSQRHAPVATNGKRSNKDGEITGTLKTLDETGYSRLLIEIALLDAAHNTYARDGAECLEAAAKRHRVNVAKAAESVASEFATRRKSAEQRRTSKAQVARKPKRRAATKAART